MLSNNKEDWEQGSVNPLNGELTTSTTRIRNKNKKQIKANTNYVIKVNNNNYKLINFEIYDKINNFITSGTNLFNISNFDNMTEIAFTSPTDAYYIIYVIRNLENTTITNTEIENINVQFEEGTTASDYVEHKEQTFTFPLGNEKLMLGDYLADDGIHHVRGQVTFDGSEDEDWVLQNAEVGQFRILYNRMTNNPILCNRFGYKLSYSADDKPYLRPVATALYAEIGTQMLPEVTVSAWKTWLSNNNVIVEYELTQEQTIPYTSAQQEVYNQIKQALSYEEQTNISSNTIALFDVEAYQSTKLVLKEMATAIVALGGV